MVQGDPSIPARLQDCDIFELSPSFLRSGSSLVGQYDERVSALIKTLSENPKVILFVDEAHSLFQSGIHERDNFTDANEGFKKALAQGDFSVIGATTTAEYRYYMEPDAALVQRFSLIRITPPTPQETLEILRGRKDEIGGFYGVGIPHHLLERVVELTEEYLLGRAQPRKSIQLLDEACAYCVTRNPPMEEVTEEAIWEALEDTIGHRLVREETLTQETLLNRLSHKVVGQEEALRGISRAVVSGLGGWVSEREAPRGVFFFGGPTGVGKTETAVQLSEILGGGRNALVRVDCNTLQPSGSDSGHALNILLGPPPGYIGYVRGKGGVLSRIREHPEGIVLFDEIEKADPGVGELLLQIMDSGRCEDSDGNLLDFRRAFLIFTTNAGAVYTNPKLIGFEPSAKASNAKAATPKTDVAGMKEEIRKMGLGEEFLGRITHFFIFRGLDSTSVQEILENQLEKLQDTAEVRGYQLRWDEAVLPHLVKQWQPRFGVRHLLSILRNRIVEQLSVADAQGELKGLTRIKLDLMNTDSKLEARDVTGLATRQRDGDTLLISLG
jgi:ATP-dependent Clp protease ATP-binding subunit ClpA